MNLKTVYKALNKPLDVFYKVIYNIYSIAYNTLIRAYKSLYKLYGCCFVGACCILFWSLTELLQMFVYYNTLFNICLCSTNIYISHNISQRFFIFFCPCIVDYLQKVHSWNTFCVRSSRTKLAFCVCETNTSTFL